MSLVRASLAGASPKLAELGLILARVGLSRAQLQADGWLDSERFARLSVAVGHALRDEAGGFLERPFRPGTFSMMCHATLSAPNLRRALLRSARFYRLMRDDLLVTPAERGEECIVFLDFPDASLPQQYFVESMFIVLIRWASWMIDANILLNRTSLSFDEPEYVDQYENMFPGQHYFRQRRNYVAFSSHYLSLPVVQDTQTLSTFLAHAPAGLLRQHRHDISTVGQVRKLLTTGDRPDLSLDDVAERLNLSEQTLRRRLKSEGATFQELKDNVRRDEAVFLLLHEDASVNRVAEQLGYSEPSTFHRAFKKWTGMAPGEYRDAHRAG